MYTIKVALQTPVSESTMAWAGLYNLFRIEIGPSSSHTLDSMVAAARSVAEMPAQAAVERLKVELFVSVSEDNFGDDQKTLAASDRWQSAFQISRPTKQVMPVRRCAPLLLDSAGLFSCGAGRTV